ncbi:MAG TPA: DctP family TRAP transporter solute-binding subunit [Chloroflexota bacterium]|nr:DctP family TRAP transporter solute-binding subunit [Chloroflexota bacterium]
MIARRRSGAERGGLGLAFSLALVLVAAGCAPQRAAAPAPTAAPAGKEVAAPAAAPAQPASAPSMTLKFSHVVARDTPKHKAAEEFGRLLKQKSNGKIELQVFANSELYKDGEEIEALQTGAIHFIAPGTDKYGVIDGQWEATALPYLFTTEDAASKFLDPNNEVAKALFESLRAKGLLGMAIWSNGFKHFSDGKRPLKTPADFQGLKFRTSGKPDEAFVKALGGSAQVMAFSEVFGALQQGVVDGQYNTWSNIYTQKFHEVQKYATISRGGAFLAYGVATNAKWFDGLDPDSKKAVTEAMKEASIFNNKISDDENATALAEIKKSGRMELYEQTAEDSNAFAKVSESVWKEWEPKTGKEIIEKLQALNK